MVSRLAARVAFVSLLTTSALGAQERPKEPVVREGACPFECCVYREWTAQAPIRVYQNEGDHDSTAFTLAPGEQFAALTGNVHVTQLGIVEIISPLYQYGVDGRTRFEPGDTLYVLDYMGEGFYFVWHEGEILDAADYWYAPDQVTDVNRAHVRAIQHREPVTEWWVQARNSRGQVGWIDMSEAVIAGADACS